MGSRGNVNNKKIIEKNNKILSTWPKLVEYVGLSEYEAKVYLSLIKLGSAGARTISINCDVPRTKVYGTVKNLIDYKLVFEIPGSPKKYAPKTPKESFEVILNLSLEKVDDFRNLIETLDKMCKEQKGPLKKEIWYLNPNENIEKKIIELFRQAKKRVNILTTEDGLEILFNISHRLLDDLQEKGVEIVINSPLDPKESSLARELSYIYEVKKTNLTSPIMYLNIDDETLFLGIITSRGEKDPFINAIFTEETELFQLINLLLNSQDRDLLNTLQIKTQ